MIYLKTSKYNNYDLVCFLFVFFYRSVILALLNYFKSRLSTLCTVTILMLEDKLLLLLLLLLFDDHLSSVSVVVQRPEGIDEADVLGQVWHEPKPQFARREEIEDGEYQVFDSTQADHTTNEAD